MPHTAEHRLQALREGDVETAEPVGAPIIPTGRDPAGSTAAERLEALRFRPVGIPPIVEDQPLTPIERADEFIGRQGAAPPEVDLTPTGQPSLLDRAGNLAARLGTRGLEVPVVTPALRRGTDEVFQALEAFGESTFRGLRFQDQVDTGDTLNLAEIINQQSTAFRERPLAAQLGIGLIDPGLFIVRAPGAAGRLTSSIRVGDVPVGPRTTEAIRQLVPSEIPPSVRPPRLLETAALFEEQAQITIRLNAVRDEIARLESLVGQRGQQGSRLSGLKILEREIVREDLQFASAHGQRLFDASSRPDVRRAISDEELLFAAGEQNRLGRQVAEASSTEQRARLDAVDRAEELRKGIEETVPNITGVLKPMTPAVEETVAKLTGLIDEARPLQREAIRVGREARSQELSSRVGRATEMEQRLRAQGVSAQEANRRATAQLGGEQPSPIFDPLQIEPNEINPLFEHISDLNVPYFNRVNTRVALERVLAGELPSRSELELLRQVFGRPLVDALRGKRPLSGKIGEVALDIFNAPRQILTAYDVSAPLRQGVVLLPSHSGRWAQSTVTMFKVLASEGAAQADDAARRADPNWLRFTARHPEGNSKNLFQADLSRGARGLSGQEEQYMSRLASLIPGIRQSQRAYVTFLNKLRYDVMTDIVAKWERAGIRPTNNDLDELALFINRATGRGSLGRLNDFAPVLNTTFFAPRLLASRVQLPFSVASSSALVRKQAATDLSAFIGTGLTVLSLASLAGASVEKDPRSSDFGKIRMGNTSLDFWGGFQSLARYASQFALGESKISAGRRRGDIRPVPGIDTAVRFLRSKLSPTAGLVADVTAFQGEDFLGNPILGDDETSRGDALKAQAFNRLVPLFEQDLINAFNDDGITGLFKAAPAGLGAGAVTFEREPGR